MNEIELSNLLMDASIDLFKMITEKNEDFSGSSEVSLLTIAGKPRKYGIDFRFDKKYVTVDYKPIVDCLSKLLTMAEIRAYMNTEKFVIQFISKATSKSEQDQYIDLAESIIAAVKNIKHTLKEKK